MENGSESMKTISQIYLINMSQILKNENKNIKERIENIGINQKDIIIVGVEEDDA